MNYAEIANALQVVFMVVCISSSLSMTLLRRQFGLVNTQAARDAYLRAAEYRNTDWSDQLFSSSIMHNHSVSASGGTDKGQYYASLSAMYDPVMV